MSKSPRFAALFALAAVLSAAGCKKAPIDDATVTAAVQTKLAGDAALSSESIQSTVQGGVATLNGAVSNEAARALASNDAAQVAGVRTVVNNLTVSSAPTVAQQQQPLPTPIPEPAVAVNTPPTRIRPVPVKPSAALDRQRVANNNPGPQMTPTPAPAPIERPAQQVAPPPPAPTFRNIEIPAGTSIPVRVTQTLDSATTQQGETFSGTVSSDVLVDGLVAIPQGSAVSGRVDAVQEAAHFKGNSLLSISLTSISRRGDRIPVSTESFTKEGAGRGKNTAVKTGAGAAAGAILGGIFGGGKGAAIGAAAGGGTGAGINAVTRGQQVQIPSETLVPFRLTNTVTVRVRTDDGARSRERQDRQNQQDPQNQGNGTDQPGQRRPLYPN